MGKLLVIEPDADAWEVVGRKVSKEQLLSDIYATAVGSVGLPVQPDSDAVRMFRLVLAEGRSLIRQRNEIEAGAVELLSELPDYQLLMTIPGIGPINAIITRGADSRNLRPDTRMNSQAPPRTTSRNSLLCQGRPYRLTACRHAIKETQ